jgi:hypothetical protein
MVGKWVNDTRIKSIVESLCTVRVELKSKVRHMKDRLGRKAKREAIKLDPSLKPKKKPKLVHEGALGPQSDLYKQMLLDEGIEGVNGMRADYYAPAPKKKKNRLGQRARKKLAEEAKAAEQRGSNRSERRSAVQKSATEGNGEAVVHENRRQKRERRLRENQNGATSDVPAPTSASTSAPTFATAHVQKSRHTSGGIGVTDAPDPSSHPSWQARSLAKEKQQNAKFTGSKMTFDSDDDE